jgi:hypothetical protein
VQPLLAALLYRDRTLHTAGFIFVVNTASPGKKTSIPNAKSVACRAEKF